MTALDRAVEDYLALRRSLGYKLRQEGQLLASLAGYLRARDLDRVTVAAALGWAAQPDHASAAWHAKRLSAIRGFAAYLATIDPASETIPRGLLPRRVSRAAPYLYSPAQIQALMAAARGLACPLRAATFETFIGLMAATGLRTGEAMALDRADADLASGALTIRSSKLGKSRLVLLHPTTSAALARYLTQRDELCPCPVTNGVLSVRGCDEAQPHQRQHHLRRPARRGGHQRRGGEPAPAALRPAAQLRGRDPGQMARRWR